MATWELHPRNHLGEAEVIAGANSKVATTPATTRKRAFTGLVYASMLTDKHMACHEQLIKIKNLMEAGVIVSDCFMATGTEEILLQASQLYEDESTESNRFSEPVSYIELEEIK